MIITIILCIILIISAVLREKYRNNCETENLYLFYLILTVLLVYI